MLQILASKDKTLDTGHAGTTYRFTTAYLSLQDGTQILTGSSRMKERPIEPLVTALQSLGANISYLEKEGYPPLEIGPMDITTYKESVSIRGDMSSQYISALLLIAPSLPNGLTIHIDGELVSRPYIEMTISLMQYFGVEVEWKDDHTLHIRHQAYIAKDITIEADWSAASYYYTIAGLAKSADITLYGLQENSLQGDNQIAAIGKKFGIITTYTSNGVRIVKPENAVVPKVFEYDFLTCPDIAQSVAVLAGGLGVDAIFSGLQTLKIKETNRIEALQKELSKVGVFFTLMPSKFSATSQKEYYMVGGKAVNDDIPTFMTYKDHRMAMAFACFSCLFPVKIHKPGVIHKSYPRFWDDLYILGFSIYDEEVLRK